MCGSMEDIQSAVAEIRRGIKKIEEDRKIHMVSLFHRATIKETKNIMSASATQAAIMTDR